MSLFLRALPLSFQTYWRYLILLPFLAIAAFVLSVIGSFIPFVSYLVPAAVSAYLVLMGLRCALVARGHYNRPSNKQLLFASFVYGILNIVATYLVTIITGVVMRRDMNVITESGPVIHDNNLLPHIFGLVSIYLILTSVFASAIAVPMTEAASAHPRGPDNGYFFGFGTGIFSLFVVMLVWAFGGQFLAFFGEVRTLFLMIITALNAALQGEDIPWKWNFGTAYLLGGTLFMAWASSWFFATAVLAWEKAGQRKKQDRKDAIEAQRISSDDLRALRKARQQGRGT